MDSPKLKKKNPYLRAACQAKPQLIWHMSADKNVLNTSLISQTKPLSLELNQHTQNVSVDAERP